MTKKGSFLTNDPSTNLGGAGDYAGRFDDGNVYSVYVRQTNPYTLEQYAEDLNTSQLINSFCMRATLDP